MRWIERGPEPDGVGGYARQFGNGWVDYFRNGLGGRPTDSYWREFRAVLEARSGGLCWYCERRCAVGQEAGGLAKTVDHFRPLSRFPELAYEWSNWIFSCYRCNSENKQDRWHELGYVDPTARDEEERPEHYFDYDRKTGDIVPRPSLTGNDKRRAESTIADLGLNKLNVLFYRHSWVKQFIKDLRSMPAEEQRAFADFILSKNNEYVGSIRMVVAQLHPRERE